ncbi:CS025 protein, partial [Centropus unirufus]|nr:CS025 protein [Centropus unirufus]
MSSKAKRVLPTRPEPPTVEQILADVQGTQPSDPVFLVPAEPRRDHGPPQGAPSPARLEGEERERLYRQSRSYVEMNQRLQESRERLREQRQELQRAGAAVERSIGEMRQKAF